MPDFMCVGRSSILGWFYVDQILITLLTDVILNERHDEDPKHLRHDFFFFYPIYLNPINLHVRRDVNASLLVRELVTSGPGL